MTLTGDPVYIPPDHRLRAFTDSSIVLAGSISETGAAYNLLESGRHGQIILFTSTYVLREIERNLYRKAPHGLRAFWERRRQFHVVDPLPELIADVARYVEPKDAPVVAAALAAQAEYLVTYDRRHLLSQTDVIRQQFGIVTVQPVEVLGRLRDRLSGGL